MKLNVARTYAVETHGGAPAVPHITPLQELRRAVLSCLLWEDAFYESGLSIADRIQAVAELVPTESLAALAVEARTEFNLRHVPLLLLKALAKRGGPLVSQTLCEVIQRADELTEFLAIYWKDKKQPLSKQVKKGLGLAFRKFNAHALAKYNRDGAIKLRDVLFMIHAKPKDEQQAAVWKQLVEGTLDSPDTWEVALSGGADKRETFERLLREGSLGYLALLRNLRNMVAANVDPGLVREAILARKGGAERVLPFRFVAAARAAPMYERELDCSMLQAIDRLPVLPGRTMVLVDVSGSMGSALSQKSDMTRMDAACALASVLNCEALRVASFSNDVIEVPPRRGMAGVDAIRNSQGHGGTRLALAVRAINEHVPHDRLIVITDEQATDGAVEAPKAGVRGYMINVAPYKHAVGYGNWIRIDGFSEGVIRYIHELEKADVG